jgi:hypothetical protein
MMPTVKPVHRKTISQDTENKHHNCTLLRKPETQREPRKRQPELI